MRNNPGFKPNVWYLSYERPGAPGLSVELNLNSVAAHAIDLAQGARVHIEGTLKGTTVIVTSITPLSPSPVETGLPITLYYYKPSLDQGPGGVQCSSHGLFAVERVIPKTQTPLRDSIQLLLRGELTEEEKAKGITTEFPLTGVTLQNATVLNGVATLTFADPEHKTGGGSCRVSVLTAQIEATAKQFPSITSVQYEPKDVFQP
jgi:spore germination protein GerM